MQKTANGYHVPPCCHHIKGDGSRCGSPALSGRNFCYYHILYRQRSKPNKKSPEKTFSYIADWEGNEHRVEISDPFAKRYTLGPIEDAASIQVAISTVLNALADQRIDLQRASTLLYGLQLAQTNLRTFQNQPTAAAPASSTSAPDAAPATPTAAAALSETPVTSSTTGTYA